MEENNNQESTTNSNSKLPLIIGGVLVLVVAVAGVMALMSGNESSTPENSVNPTSLGMQNENPGMEEDNGVVTINMNAGAYYFDPSEIRVKQGDTVRIVLNGLDMMHNLAIDEFDVESDIVEEGESTTIEFVADIAGEFEYYCSVGDHRDRGQVGTLIVE